MTTYRLHCFKESGNSYKVALALAIAGVTWEKVAVDYFDGQTGQSGWRSETNEMGEVPVLEIDGCRIDNQKFTANLASYRRLRTPDWREPYELLA